MELHMPLRYLVISVALLATGCGVIPHTSSFTFAPGTTRERIFFCAENATRTLRKTDDFWPEDVRLRDRDAGVFQMGDYAEWNTLGYRFRLEIRGSKGVIHLRATSLYLKDLGAKAASSKLRGGILRCLSHLPTPGESR